MTEWILILTVATHVNSGSAIVPTTVRGFETKAACLSAGNAWIRAVHRKAKDRWVSLEFTSAICAPSK